MPTETTQLKSETSPFHAGEQQVQERLGVRSRMEQFGRRVIRDVLPTEHREFYAQLPFIAIGHVDTSGRPWASLVAGQPGFLATPDERTLQVNASPLTGDPLENVAANSKVGVLGLEPSTRRRNRMTGRLLREESGGLSITVQQSFGNCPQYIHARAVQFSELAPSQPNAGREESTELDLEARLLIGRSDTFFVASATKTSQTSEPNQNRSDGADVSHRGGQPGFVGIEGSNTLVIPDFSGNHHFNTLGNFVVNPRAGLLFIDFEQGTVLMLSGSVRILWDGPEVDSFAGAERLWKFDVERMVRLRKRLPLKFHSGEHSPSNALTGTWSSARAHQKTDAQLSEWRPLRVVKIVEESREVRSLFLEPARGGTLRRSKAGQHLPIRAQLDSHSTPQQRTYTLSSSPTDRFYRISVKREPGGLVSHFIHDKLTVGATLLAQAPRGHFIFDASDCRPAVLLSAGIGVTPMIAMLRAAAAEGLRSRHTRKVTFLHAAKSTAERAFRREVLQLVQAGGSSFRAASVVSKALPGETVGTEFEGIGRIDSSWLAKALPKKQFDVYLCGPSAFVTSMYRLLRDRGVPNQRIHTEAFGPSSLKRDADPGDSPAPKQPPAAEAALLTLTRSRAELAWNAEDGNLLQWAEQHGLSPDFGCRAGSCGGCAVTICSGSVTYSAPPTAPIPEGQALLCLARPARTPEPTRLELDL